MRSVRTSRDAIDAFERGQPGLSAEDVQFLDRLRNERFADQVAEAWRYIPTTDVRVIERAVKALRVANALPKVSAETDKNRHDLLAVKDAVRIVRDHFANRVQAINLQRELAWAEKDIEANESLCDLDLSGDAGFTVAWNSEKLPQLSRKYKTLGARRGTFMVQLRQAMHDIFGKPCNRAVAAMTTVAFGVDTSIDDVCNAWKRSIQRKI
jgi:hypothetical protein